MDEVDFEAAKPVKLASEVSPEKTLAFFKGDVEAGNPLKPKEVTEELLARLYENMQEAEHLAKLIELDKADLKELGHGLESVQKGKYVAFFKEVKGRRTVRWEDYVKAQLKTIPAEELAPYVKEGEPSVRLEIKKVN